MSWWYRLESMRQWFCGQSRTLLSEHEGGCRGNISFLFKNKIPFCSRMNDKIHACLPSIPCQDNHNYTLRSNLPGSKDSIMGGCQCQWDNLLLLRMVDGLLEGLHVNISCSCRFHIFSLQGATMFLWLFDSLCAFLVYQAWNFTIVFLLSQFNYISPINKKLI